RVFEKISPDWKFSGLPQSPNFGFGEIVKFQLGKMNGRSFEGLMDEIRTPILNKDKFNSSRFAANDVTKKILPISEMEFQCLQDTPEFSDSLRHISGFITFASAMTSHSAVFARGLGLACIMARESIIPLCLDYNFAAVRDGRGCLYRSPPGELLSYL
ncbi:MAG: PEP-utilizing enzyme, partial [Geminicoccaceae bacterium]